MELIDTYYYISLLSKITYYKYAFKREHNLKQNIYNGHGGIISVSLIPP